MDIALSFDDVLIVPQRGILASRNDADISTKLCEGITLNVPIISSNMDTVTEDKMAIAVARAGGLGIIHRYCSVEHQVTMVKKVKRAEHHVIEDPYTIDANSFVWKSRELMEQHNVGSLLVTDDSVDMPFVGLLTSRDVRFRDEEEIVGNLMRPLSDLVWRENGHELTLEDCKQIMAQFRVKKLPLVLEGNRAGLVCAKDILHRRDSPNSTRDPKGRLMVGAAIGLDDLERAKVLIEAGADTLVLDVAHGHCDRMLWAIRNFKERWPDFPLGAGNVATGEGYLDLVEAGADWVKVGVGGGSICKTRIVSGAGVPTFQSILDCSGTNRSVSIVADGGIKTSGDIAKAIGAGASTVMLGSLLAGTEESPGVPIVKNGKKVKIIRGMAGIGANWDRKQKKTDIVPEGVEGFVDFKGPVGPIIDQLAGGLRSGMSYSGTDNISDMQKKTKFVRQTASGARESAPHDLKMV